MSNIQNVKDIPIDEVIEDFGIELKSISENEMVALCPFHKEKRPSFGVNTEKNIFHCFGCGASGNVITFVKKFKGIDFREAVHYLRKKYNVKYTFSNLEKIRKKPNYRKEILVFYRKVGEILDEIWDREWVLVKPFYGTLHEYSLKKEAADIVFECLIPICDFDIFEFRFCALSDHVDSFFSSTHSDRKGLQEVRKFYRNFLKRRR